MSANSSDLSRLSRRGGHRTLAEQGFASLHEAIVTGLLEPGTRLQIEELAEILEMSPMPIREALRRLDAAGMVENVPHRGAKVTELSIKDLKEVYEARLALEPLAIRRGAERFDESDTEAAREALDRHQHAAAAGDLAEAWTAHTDFHMTLYAAGDNRWLVRLITPLWETSERYRHSSEPLQARLAERQREHDRILEACIAHDPERAGLELHNHLVVTANQVSSQMGGPELFSLVPIDNALERLDIQSIAQP